MAIFRLEQQLVENAASFTQKRGLECLAELQHQGAATRLLDVTIDPMAGLWFAVNDERYWNEDGVVYAFESSRMDQQRVSDHPSSTGLQYYGNGGLDRSYAPPSKLTLVEVPRNSDRIKAQRGSFVLLPLVAGDKTDLNYSLDGSGSWASAQHVLASDPHSAPCPAVLALEIPADQKPRLKDLLTRAFGFSSAEIYPDLAGYCAANSARKEFENSDLPTLQASSSHGFETSDCAILIDDRAVSEARIPVTPSDYEAWRRRTPAESGASGSSERALVFQADNDVVIAAGVTSSYKYDETQECLVVEFNITVPMSARFSGFRVPVEFRPNCLFFASNYVSLTRAK